MSTPSEIEITDPAGGPGRTRVPAEQKPGYRLYSSHTGTTAVRPAVMNFAYTKRTQGLEIIGPPRTEAFVDGSLAP